MRHIIKSVVSVGDPVSFSQTDSILGWMKTKDIDNIKDSLTQIGTQTYLH